MQNSPADVCNPISYLTQVKPPQVKLWTKITAYFKRYKKINSKKIVGQKAETIAIDFLKQKGFQFIERNYRSPFGEIDIIMRDNKQLVFVEVKSRNITGLEYGLPERAVNKKKRHQLYRLAKYYIGQHRQEVFSDYRMDIVSIVMDQQDKVISITHLPDAF